jgi:hypothetical protein
MRQNQPNRMAPSYDIVTSAENNLYNAWQAMLFHYSCQEYAGQTPIIVVHGDGRQLRPGFREIQRTGGRVQYMRNFRHDGGFDYPPRNTAGSLFSVRSDADYVVLCDPDMIFFRPLPMEKICLEENEVSFDVVPYLNINQTNRGLLTDVCRRAGGSLELLKNSPISGGVPHIVPAALREPLSQQWLQNMEYFEPVASANKSRGVLIDWHATMWALVIAARQLNLEPVMTEFCLLNKEGQGAFSPDSSSKTILHYCFGDSVFDKKRYSRNPGLCEKVWQAEAPEGTLNGAICAQLSEAREYYNSAKTVSIQENRIVPEKNLPDQVEVPDNTLLMVTLREEFDQYTSLVEPLQGEKERDWFVPQAYFCLPLIMGNQHGFIVKSLYDFWVTWKGGDSRADVVIRKNIEDQKLFDVQLITSHFGMSTFTIGNRWTFRTPKGINLMVVPPPNFHIDGIGHLTAVIETDNLRRDFTFNLRVTRKNEEIFIPKGSPIGCVLPYPRHFIDHFQTQLASDVLDPEVVENERLTMRYHAMERGQYDVKNKHGVGRRYTIGEDVYGNKFSDHQTTLDAADDQRPALPNKQKNEPESTDHEEE